MPVVAGALAGTPEGDVVIVNDPSGNAIAFPQVDRPRAMDRAYTDQSNIHALRADP